MMAERHATATIHPDVADAKQRMRAAASRASDALSRAEKSCRRPLPLPARRASAPSLPTAPPAQAEHPPDAAAATGATPLPQANRLPGTYNPRYREESAILPSTPRNL
jgi:hypothetical protein